VGPDDPLPRGPWFCLSELNLPGSILVNGADRRFMNEAPPYVEAVHEINRGGATGVPHVRCWMIVDQRYRNRYLFAGLGPRSRSRRRGSGTGRSRRRPRSRGWPGA
jgi:3-oxosteroid 1-dehydrogenase